LNSGLDTKAPSQFNREYKRFSGQQPMRDIKTFSVRRGREEDAMEGEFCDGRKNAVL
jgi:hypothetical protein